MQYEVENKFPVRDLDQIARKLEVIGVRFDDPIEQVDMYFAHPARDFAQTDEAFRIRRIGRKTFVTYKGPKIDQATKTRRELELPLPDGEDIARQYAELFEALGFRPVAEVRKHRRCGHCSWDGSNVELALDEVEQLGHFVELEILANQDTLAQAQSRLLRLAAHLQLPTPERRSYLGMLLEKN